MKKGSSRRKVTSSKKLLSDAEIKALKGSLGTHGKVLRALLREKAKERNTA